MLIRKEDVITLIVGAHSVRATVFGLVGGLAVAFGVDNAGSAEGLVGWA